MPLYHLLHGGPVLRRLLVCTCLLLALTLLPRGVQAADCIPTPVQSNISNDSLLPPQQECDPAAAFTYSPASQGKVIGAGLIYLYANDEARNSSLNNVLHAVSQLEGKYIYPGEIFSFNRSAGLLQQHIPYDLGPDVNDNLVWAGGVCMVSTMVATAAHDAGLPFVSDRGRPIATPVPHSRFYKYYHQVNQVDNHVVPIVESSVSIKRDSVEIPWQTESDMQFVNTTGRILVLHFEPSFTVSDLDLSQPFGLIQHNYTFKVELRAVSTGFDAWFDRLNSLFMN